MAQSRRTWHGPSSQGRDARRPNFSFRNLPAILGPAHILPLFFVPTTTKKTVNLGHPDAEEIVLEHEPVVATVPKPASLECLRGAIEQALTNAKEVRQRSR
jgi:hypothetical protein